MKMLTPFIQYVKNPEYDHSPAYLNVQGSVAFIGKSVLIYLGFGLLSGIFIILPIYSMNLVPDHVTKFYPLTFNVLVLAPLFEELIFRLPLRFSARNLFIFIGTLVVLIMNKNFNLYISLGSGLLIAYIPFSKVFSMNLLKKIENSYIKYYKYIFYLGAFIFGFIHIFNYENLETIHLIIAPLIVINQIFMGFLLGFARVKYKFGFLYGFFIHASINLIFLLPQNLL